MVLSYACRSLAMQQKMFLVIIGSWGVAAGTSPMSRIDICQVVGIGGQRERSQPKLRKDAHVMDMDIGLQIWLQLVIGHTAWGLYDIAVLLLGHRALVCSPFSMQQLSSYAGRRKS